MSDRRGTVVLREKGISMTMADYEDHYRALMICIAAQVPVILWGPPGQGKTAVIRDIAQQQDRYLEILLASIREPQDFAGLPSIVDGRSTLVAPDWARRLADLSNGILFIDEVNTAPPSVQAALLRVTLDRVAGDCPLGERTSVVAAANPPEQAANGWDLAPALANRFCHLAWDLPADVVRDGFAGRWPRFELSTPPESAVAEAVIRERVRVGGFLAVRPELVTMLPDAASEQGRAYPTPRAWDMAALLSAWASVTLVRDSVRRVLVRGCVGPGASAEYLFFRENLDLPDPEEVLRRPMDFVMPNRADRLHVIGAGILAVLRRSPSNARWQAAGVVLERFAHEGYPDVSLALARDWMGQRPDGLRPDPAVLRSLLPLMKEARLV
jgi:MoxR-like ATPase